MRILVTYLVLIVMIACAKEEATSKVEENNSKQQNMVIKAKYTDYYHPYIRIFPEEKEKLLSVVILLKKEKSLHKEKKQCPRN